MIALHIGAGGQRIPADICGPEYEQVAIDMVPPADIIGDVRCLPFPDEHADMVYSAHLLEHLPEDDTVTALREWRRVLKPGGQLIVRVPDAQAACKQAAEHGMDCVLYQSAVGPIRAQDVLFGFQPMVRESEYMRHKVGFDHPKLGRATIAAGFAKATVLVGRHEYELECIATK